MSRLIGEAYVSLITVVVATDRLGDLSEACGTRYFPGIVRLSDLAGAGNRSLVGVTTAVYDDLFSSAEKVAAWQKQTEPGTT